MCLYIFLNYERLNRPSIFMWGVKFYSYDDQLISEM